MIQKPNIKSCQELTSDEIREAQDSLNKRIRYYKPKIVAFNGKTIFEIYTGSSVDKEFNFGKQPIRFANNTTDTFMFVLPSSSARCSQLPKVADKVPFYLALKKFREYLNGYLSELSDLEIMFPDFKVALEVSNDEAANLNSSKKNKDYMSDSEDNNSMLDETTNNHDSTVAGNNHKIKFVRLNNIPFSEIPADILENLKVQRKLKKNVTIITSTKDHFQKNIKKSTLFSSTNLHSHSHINPSSDLDTATSDSSDYCANSISNEPHESMKPQQMQLSQQPSSKLTSLILNVCSSATGSKSDQPSTPVLNRSSHVVEQNLKPIVVQTPPQQQQQTQALQHSPAPILINKTGNNSTIKQILAAPINKAISIDSNTKSKYINQQSNTSSQNNTKLKESQQPIQNLIQPQSKVIQMNDNSKKIIIINTNSNGVVSTASSSITNQIVAPEYEANENDILIEYELLKPNSNRYNCSDYFTFEPIGQPTSHYHPSTNYYGEELKHDLNRVIKLYYGDETPIDEEEYASSTNVTTMKRTFATINDADLFIQNSKEAKRICNVNFHKL